MHDYQKVYLYVQDENRFGLFTKNGKTLTAKGVKPICPFHQVFQSIYLYSVFSPLNGNHFLLELTHCNSMPFQLFLDVFSKQSPDELKLIVLDNGAFHKTKSLSIPDNIVLIFLPPYSPELNPAERIWVKFKRDFTNRLFHTLEDLEDYVCMPANSLTLNEVISIKSSEYFFSYPHWTII